MQTVQPNITPKIAKLIKTLDEQLNKRAGYSANDIQGTFNKLLAFRQVEVGYRSSCGKTDSTMFTARAWTRLLKQLRKDGFIITEQNVKHDNAWATLAGGFWNSTIYKLENYPSN